MTVRTFIISLCCAVLSGVSFSDAAPQLGSPALRNALDVTYNTWRLHMMRGNYEGWQSLTSSYRQMKVRNLAVSEKRPFPASLFRQPMAPPALAPLMFVGALIDGPTAAATYYGKIDLGLGVEPKESNALVLLFTYERGKWCYDQARFFNLSKLNSVKERLQRGDSSVLLEQDGFHPQGVIPPTPKACNAPQYIAKILVDCPGRLVKAKINGISDHEFDNTRQAEVISGGLHMGMNSMYITFEDSPTKEQKGALLVEIYIMPETPGNLPARAVHYYVPVDKLPQSGNVNINITPELLKTMIPVKSTPAKKK
ncbi:MAG: hypothetical protein Q4C05_00305 [Akkermansia sp.]|nr:hypothetical protein [Akkermansia sp.]